jgi:plastocyanin
MWRRLVMAAAISVAAVTNPIGAHNTSEPKPTTHRVTIDATSFKPAELTIRAGDSIVWMNRDVIPHTATQSGGNGFDSGTMKSGDAWKHTFKTAGDIAYICSFHPTMKGRVKVQ